MPSASKNTTFNSSVSPITTSPSVRFGPFPLFEQTTPLASLATHLFSVELVGADPTSFYVPLIDLPARPETLGWGDSRDMTAPWTVDPLTV